MHTLCNMIFEVTGGYDCCCRILGSTLCFGDCSLMTEYWMFRLIDCGLVQWRWDFSDSVMGDSEVYDWVSMIR